jgi:hypothetical protein
MEKRLASVPSEEMRTVPSVRTPSTSMAKSFTRDQRAGPGIFDFRFLIFDWGGIGAGKIGGAKEWADQLTIK